MSFRDNQQYLQYLLSHPSNLLSCSLSIDLLIDQYRLICNDHQSNYSLDLSTIYIYL